MPFGRKNGQFQSKMPYFGSLCSILTGLLFLIWNLWREIKVISKIPKILLDDKFPEFSFGKIRFFADFNLLNLKPFAVLFRNGRSTYHEEIKVVRLNLNALKAAFPCKSVVFTCLVLI